MRLTIALATRQRPGHLVRTVETTLKNMRNDATRLVILADDDDYGTLSVKSKIDDERILWSIESRPDALGAKYNRAMKIAPADVYMVMVDYAPCVTEDFDNVILGAAQV